MRDTLTYTDTLSILECGSCHISFAIPRDMLRARKEDGRDFWCPNGHQIRYSETDNQKLKRKAEREERWRLEAEAQLTHERDQREAAERSAAAYKGRVTRLKNRAAAGVCPCCNRSFENLRRHMNTRHPDFRTEQP